MHSVRQKCRPKHQVLVLKCYPRFQKGVQSVKPNPSELSYLLYYVSTRRTKLQKVGAFLEKRAARDVWRVKLGNVQVTLQLLTALIEKVPRDLPLYARSVLTVLGIVLRSREISMVEETLPTFEMLCRHLDDPTLISDQDSTTLYRDIVRTYSTLASTDSTSISKTSLSPQMVLRWRTVGLRAIKSLVTFEALSSDGSQQLNTIIPVILENLYTDGDHHLSPLQEKAQSLEKQELEQARRRRTSIATVQTVDTTDGNPAFVGSTADADKIAQVETRVLALRCLERIFTPGSHRVQIRLATSLVLSFIISRRPPHKQETEQGSKEGARKSWATDLLQAIVNWSPVQDRFIILVTMMESLVERPLVDGQLEPQITLAAMIDWLLSSSINLIGLSVLDVLLGLVQAMLFVVQLGDTTLKITPSRGTSAFVKPLPQLDAEKAMSNSDRPTSQSASSAAIPMRGELLQLLVKCIGNLTTHVYYSDQVTDMIRAVVSRIKPSRTPDDRNVEADSDAENTGSKSNHSPTEAVADTFSLPVARLTALQSIKEILIVANLRKSMSGTGPDSRNPVPLKVWEGTQWLLRDPSKEVQRAYVDALLSWLQLETSKNDLQLTTDHSKIIKDGSKQDPRDHSERLAKRVIPHVSQRERAEGGGAAIFLQLLHLAIFDAASDPSASESDILILHLLLVNLLENLGINAARYSLPVIMRLQAFSLSPESTCSPTATLQISSLVHGYLWALVEKFNMEDTKVGNQIVNEISNRKKRGIWFDKIQLPPRPLQHIIATLDSKVNQDSLPQPSRNAYSPFTALNQLVAQIESAYSSSTSPKASPANSPGRTYSVPAGQPHHNVPRLKISTNEQLPPYVKEQMLSAWSKEACLAAVESEKTKSASLSGSRTGASASRKYFAMNAYKQGTGSPTGTEASFSNRRNFHQERTGLGVFGDGPRSRRQSVHETPRTPRSASSRDSTVRVSDLRRVLSSINNSKLRQSSPLGGRSRPDSSSSESMVSDNLSASDVGPTSEGELEQPAQAEPATSRVATDKGGANRQHALNRVESDDIPPVPPLPSSLSIPGGFPGDSRPGSFISSPQHSPVRSDRPSTAPSGRNARQPAKGQNNNVATVRKSRSLTRKKSRTGKPETNDTETTKVPSYRHSRNNSERSGGINGEGSSHWSRHEASRTLSIGRQVDVDKLLEGLTLRNGSEERVDGSHQTNGVKVPSYSLPASATIREGKKPYNLATTDDGNQHLGDRKSIAASFGAYSRPSSMRGGIGPPPY